MARYVTKQRGDKTVTVKSHGFTWWLLVGWWARLFTLPSILAQRAAKRR